MAAYSALRQLPHLVARGGPRSLPHDKLGPLRSSSPNGRAAYDRHGCFGPPRPLAGAAWLWAGGGGISTSVWRIMTISVEWRIESTAGSPVVGRFAVAADKPAQPPDVAQGIVANAQAQKDPLAALRALNDGYAAGPRRSGRAASSRCRHAGWPKRPRRR